MNFLSIVDKILMLTLESTVSIEEGKKHHHHHHLEPEFEWVRKKERRRSRSPSLLMYLAGGRPS